MREALILTEASLCDRHRLTQVPAAFHLLHHATESESVRWLGVAYIDLKRYPDAVIAIRRAIQLNPNQYAFRNNLAFAYSEEANWKDAMNPLGQEQPLADRLNNAQVWYFLGNGYLRLWNSAKSVPAFQHCIRVQRRLAPCWTNLGVMLEWGGNDQEALQAYTRATALGTRWPQQMRGT